MPEIFRGSCLCGAVQYELRTPPKAISHCHCSQCRKGHGAAFASYGSVLRTDLQIVQGEERITPYPSSEFVIREFCSGCGSSLFWSKRQGEYADWISVALGTLDTPFIPERQRHVEVASKVSWYDIEDRGPTCQ